MTAAAKEREGREKKSVSRLDREKDESSDWERESISMVTTVMVFFPSHSPPPSLPVSSPLSFAPSSHVSVPRRYTISHLTCFFFCLQTEASQFLCRI